MTTRRWPGLRFLLAAGLSLLFLAFVGRTLFVPRRETPEPGNGTGTGRGIPRGAGAGESDRSLHARAPGEQGKPGAARRSSIAGRVLDPEGTPAAGARVSLRRAGAFDPELLRGRQERPLYARVAELALQHAPVADEALLGGDGRFEFQAAPGRYLLVARAEDKPSWVGEPLDLDREVEIEISLAEGRNIAGKVLDLKGSPLPGAEVSASLVERHRLGGETLPFFPEDLTALLVLDEALRARRGTCGQDGVFRIPALLDFKYDLKAQASGHAPGDVRGVQGGETGVEILLEGGKVVRGRVALPSGAPVPGATVSLFRAEESPSQREPTSDSPMGAPASVADTGSRGEFESSPLPPGGYQLQVRGKGIQQTALDVSLEDGPEKLDLEILVKPGRKLRGMIANARGAPLPNVRVRILEDGLVRRPAGEARASFAGEGPAVILQTDRDGRFLADTLREGACSVEVESSGPYPAVRQEVAAAQADVLIILPEGSPVFLGLAVEAVSGKPIPRARAILFPAAESPVDRQETSADTDGRFRFFSTRVGKARVEVQSPKHLTVATPELMLDPSGSPAEVTLELPKAGLLTGIVVVSTGEPLPGAEVSCAREERDGTVGWARWVRPAVTGADGTFALSLSKARPGATYWISASHPHHFLPEEVPVFLEDPAKGVTEVKVMVRRASTLEGTVTLSSRPAREGVVRVLRLLAELPAHEPESASVAQRESEAPLAKGTLSAAFLPGIAEAESLVDPGGRFKVSGLRPGTYRLAAEARGSAPYRGEPFSLAEGAEMAVDIELQPEETIQGTILDAEGNALAGARVSAVAAGASRHMPPPAVAGRDGRYILRGLNSAAYTLTARKEGFSTRMRPEVRPSDRQTDFVLLPHGKVKVAVADSRTGAPVGAFFVDLLPDEQDLQVHEDPGTGDISSSTGEFLAAGVPPGRYRLLVAAPGYIVHESPLAVESGKTAEAAVFLDPGEEVAGTVVTSAGLPLEAARVLPVPMVPRARPGRAPAGNGPGSESRPPDDAAPPADRGDGVPDIVHTHGPGQPVERLSVLTDREGGFTIRGLEAGVYCFQASHDRHSTEMSPPVVVPATSEARAGPSPPRVRLVLRPAAIVSGRVLSRRGDPLAGIQVQISGNREIQNTLSNDRGEFLFRAVPAGSHTLSRVKHGVSTQCGSVAVTPDNLEVRCDVVVDED